MSAELDAVACVDHRDDAPDQRGKRTAISRDQQPTPSPSDAAFVQVRRKIRAIEEDTQNRGGFQRVRGSSP